MMFEMIHYPTGTGVTEVVWKAAVLRYRNNIEKLTYYSLSCRVSLKKPITEGKMVRRGRRGIRRKQLLYGLTEKR